MPRFNLLASVIAALAVCHGAFAAPSPAEIKDYLDGHNLVRRSHGARDLVWDQGLSDAAQRWANGCEFEHSNGAVGRYGGQ